MPSNTLEMDVRQQLQNELKSFPTQSDPEGETPETINPDHLKMLEQKFGLIAPILTPSEKNLIAKEERLAKG